MKKLSECFPEDKYCYCCMCYEIYENDMPHAALHHAKCPLCGRNNMYYKNREVIILGGSGSLGNALVKAFIKMPEHKRPKGIRIYSRGEMLQYEMKKRFIDSPVPISFLIGDVRDLERLKLAMRGVDIVIHAAALKQITACNNNPIEAISTNVYGSQNVILASLKESVEKVMFISTDKAVEPWTLYGSTKKSAESLFVNANIYSGGRAPKFSCCRYGNIMGSRGSVVPLFKKQRKSGELTVTHPQMTRFFMSLEAVAQFIIDRVITMRGGEIYIPKMHSCNILDLAKHIAPKASIKFIGIRNDEKMHEILVAPNEKYKLGIRDEFYEINERLKTDKPLKINYSSDDQRFIKPIEYFMGMI